MSKLTPTILSCRALLCLLVLSMPAVVVATEAVSDHEQKFQSKLNALQKKYGFPGATAAFALPDGKVGVAVTGLADVEARTPMTVKSRMLAASIGKSFVGATVVMLAREGKLKLDTPVSHWLGDRKWFHRLPNHKIITLRQLLTHSSGLPDHVHQPNFAKTLSEKWKEKKNPFSPEDLIQFVLDKKPLFEAGKGWAYSDTGYILAGLIIKKVTGRSYYTEIQERFINPIGLKMTSPSNRRFLPGLAAGYMAADNAFRFPKKTTLANGVMAWHPGIEWTGGGLVSTSADLARWGNALFSGQASTGAYLNTLLKSVAVSPKTNDIQYGLGVAIYRKGPFGPVYGHGGWIPGYSSSLRYYPDHNVTIAFQINTDIGIVDNKSDVIQEMETQLAKIVISTILKK